MSHLVIIEGLDGAGKTTVAEAIARDMGSHTALLHAGSPLNQDVFNEYVLPLETLVHCKYTNIVCDRWHLGEFVWPYVFNREPMKFHGLKDFEQNFVVIFDRIDVIFIDAGKEFIEQSRELEYDYNYARMLYHEVCGDTILPVYIFQHPQRVIDWWMKGDDD